MILEFHDSKKSLKEIGAEALMLCSSEVGFG